MSKKQILIVEDSEINREILKDILCSEYEVLEAENGQLALDILKEKYESISVVLLDVVMPVMDGYTLLNKMKQDENLSVIPVIIMTNGNTESEEITALANGATDFLPKPYRPKVILHRIAGFIKLRETSALVNLFKYDRLTGYYSKDYFYQKVRNLLDDNPDNDYIILCSNIENFKIYNDSYGWAAGDQLLVKHADLLRRRVGEGIICGRYGADRLLLCIDKNLHKKLDEKFAKLSNQSCHDKIENMSVKFGVYEITDRSLPVEQMCDRALLAVDTVKGIYNTFIAEYKDDMRSQLLREKDITDVMEDSLQAGHFKVFFQPKYNLKDDKVVGAEALVRWNHPELGFLSPGEFIPLFEKNGFIHKLDYYVWETVCKKLHEWKEKNIPVVPISVNVSRADIFQDNLLDLFKKLVSDYQIDPSLLHLEITESAYTESQVNIIETVEEFRKLGFVIEMDDFGSGYSSLNMLSQMSIDILKLDMAFIRSEISKPIERRLINDIVNMAHRMNLQVVAEGVETEDHRDRLRTIGCDYAQGYYYAKPMPENDFEQIISTAGHVDSTAYKNREESLRLGLTEGSKDCLDKLISMEDLLPGGFFIYRADGTGEIISVNSDLVNMFGCNSEDEFRQHTGNSFKGMVHPDDLQNVEINISSQIEKENDIDYVEYRIVCKDGSVKSVRDYRKFVHTDEYGDVYYVLIFDITE